MTQVIGAIICLICTIICAFMAGLAYGREFSVATQIVGTIICAAMVIVNVMILATK